MELEPDNDPIPTNDEIATILREEMGLIKVSKREVINLSKLGVYLKGNGVVKNQRGVAFVSQMRLASAMEILHAELSEGVSRPKRKKGQTSEEAKLKTEDICRLAHELGFVAGKLNESQEVMLRMSGTTPSPDTLPPPEAPTRHSFPAGSTVVFGGNVQFNENPPAVANVEPPTPDQKSIAKKL